MSEQDNINQAEATPQKPFQVDFARLTEYDLKNFNNFLERSKHLPENERLERLNRPYFLTGEEHLWIGSTTEFQYSYPLTPAALIYFPDRLNEINKKRKELMDIPVGKWLHGTQITPNPSEAGYQYAYLSLEELDPTTGERKNTPRVAALANDAASANDRLNLWDNEQNKIRDPEILKKFSYNPNAFMENRIAQFDRKIKSAEGKKLKDYYRLEKELFLRHYRLD